MRSWRPWAFAVGVVIALGGLAVGVYLNQSIIALVSVLVALFTALSPTVVPSLSDEIQGNNSRYERHRQYFANVILPTAGSMELIEPQSIRLVETGRLGWRIAGTSGTNPPLPGLDEHRIPAYNDVFLPHLAAGTSDRVWRQMERRWKEAAEAVRKYSFARWSFDTALFATMDRLVREKVGPEFEPAWQDYRGAREMNGRTYHAPQIRDCVEYWYEGRYGQPGWQWIGPVIAEGSALGGVPWAVTVGGSSMVLLWGGPVPKNLADLKVGITEVIDLLRADKKLKNLHEEAARLEREARLAVAPLSSAAFDAANLLQHGPDIPGECAYCRTWHPRF